MPLVKAKPIPCVEPGCDSPTLCERGRRGRGKVRVCARGHRGIWSDVLGRYGRVVDKVKKDPHEGLWKCWCQRPTIYMPSTRFIKRGRFVIRVCKRRCSEGHRGWFRLASDGGKLVERVKPQGRPRKTLV